MVFISAYNIYVELVIVKAEVNLQTQSLDRNLDKKFCDDMICSLHPSQYPDLCEEIGCL